MIELDRAALQRIRERAERVLYRDEVRQRNRPLREAFEKQIEVMQTSFIPDLLAEPEARVRRSVLSLEESFRDYPEKQKAIEDEWLRLLGNSRARTVALRRWLESLS